VSSTVLHLMDGSADVLSFRMACGRHRSRNNGGEASCQSRLHARVVEILEKEMEDSLLNLD